MKNMEELRTALRTAVADYMCSEGCSCCRNSYRHEENAARLAELLHVEPYEDGSGFNFFQYRSKEGER